MSINQVAISGNLVRDAEVRRTQSGMAIVSFTVAVNERRKNNQTGEWDDYVNFIDVTWFGAYAEKCSSSLVKGARVALSGRLRWSQWERDGQKRSKLEVIAEEVMMPPRAQQAPQQQAPQQQIGVPQFTEVYDEDIPF